jgi:hypothetical protein
LDPTYAYQHTSSLFAWVINPNANNAETTAETKHTKQAHNNIQYPNWKSAVLGLSINKTPATSIIFCKGKQPITSSNLLQPTRSSSIISSNLPLPARSSSMMSSNLLQPKRTSSIISSNQATYTNTGRNQLYHIKQPLPIQAGNRSKGNPQHSPTLFLLGTSLSSSIATCTN